MLIDRRIPSTARLVAIEGSVLGRRRHEARVRQSFLKLTDSDRFKIRGPDRTDEGMVLEMLRNPAVFRSRMAEREKGRDGNAHGQNKEDPGRQSKPPNG